MVGPEDWGAQPAQAESPQDWGAEPKPQERGLLPLIKSIPGDIAAVATPQGRAAWAQVPGAIWEGMKQWFATPGEVSAGRLRPDDQIEWALQTAMGEAGGGAIKPVPRGITEAVKPAMRAFDEGVTAPAAARLDAFARVGDPNGVRLETPAPDIVPSPIKPIEGSPFGDIPRSIAARTDIPEVDAIINSEQPILDNAIVDRTRDIPNSWGGHTELKNPTTFIDRRFPKELTVDGVTFDPAEPAIIHENIEHKAIQLLTDADMEPDAALSVAYWGWGNPAEHAWYSAHGMDPEHVEAALRPILDKIATEKGANVPDGLFRGTYPDGDPQKASAGEIRKPTPEEAAQGMQIIRDWAAKQTTSAQPMLEEARDLGVIGQDRARPAIEESPAAQAQRDIPSRNMAAARTGDDKITMTPRGEFIGAYQARFKEWVGKIKAPGDLDDLIAKAADENEYFPEARAGNVPAAHVEKVADAAGLDPKTIDQGGLSTRFNRPAQIRAVEQALLQTRDDFREAAAVMDGEPSAENAAKMLETRIRRDYVLEYTLGLRAEWGKAGSALKDILDVTKREQAVTDLLKDKGETIDDMREVARGMRGLDGDQAAKVMSGMRGQNTHWFFWLWQQGLISGLLTHTKYLFVNTAETMLDRTIEPLVSAAIGKMRGERVSFGAPILAYADMIRSAPDAFVAAGEAFKSGLRVPLLSEIELAKRAETNPELAGAQVPYMKAGGPEWGIWKRVFNEDQLATAAKVLGIPGKSANMIHTFYKVLNERAALSSRAYDQAYKEGLSPIKDGEDFWQRYNQHVTNPSDEMLKGAIDDAYQGAFMEKLGEKTQRLASALKSNPITQWIFPFLHIPLNIARAGIQRTPVLSALGPEMRAALMGERGASAQNLAIAKLVTGSSIIAYFADKTMSGDATGDYPVDPVERRRWKMLGIQPNSLNVDGQWISMERLGPPGNVARLAANFTSIMRDYKGDDEEAPMKAAWAAIRAAGSIASDEVGFQGLRNIIEAYQDPRQAAKFAAWQIGSFMIYPSSFLSQLASAHDPEMREAVTLLDGLKYRIPFARETLLPRRDPLYGEPVPNPGYGTILRQTQTNADPVKAELDRIGYYPTAPQKKIGEVKLTTEQYDRYEATAGPLVKEMLRSTVNTSHYQELPTGAQRAMVKGIIEAGRAKARQAMLTDPTTELLQKGMSAARQRITGQP